MPVYVLRAFGGVLILNAATPPPSAPPINVTWLTRDGIASWRTRDGKATFVTRDGKATWKTRS